MMVHIHTYLEYWMSSLSKHIFTDRMHRNVN